MGDHEPKNQGGKTNTGQSFAALLWLFTSHEAGSVLSEPLRHVHGTKAAGQHWDDGGSRDEDLIHFNDKFIRLCCSEMAIKLSFIRSLAG